MILRAVTTAYDYYAYIDYQQQIQTYTKLLSTDALLGQASETLGYSVRGVLANASQIGDMQFVRLSVTHSDAVKAAEIANVLVKVLIDQNEQLQSVRYEATERNLQQRVDQALEEIELLQSKIDQLSSVSVKEQLEQVESEITELQDQIINLETQINDLDTQIKAFTSLLATEEQIAQHETNQAQLAELKAQLNQLTPVLSLYQQIYTNLTVLGRSPDNSLSSSIELSQLQTNLNLYQQIYVNSISSLEALNLARAQNAPNVIQVEPTRVPRSPISPRPFQTAALFGVISLLAISMIVFLVEYLDDTIKTLEDVKQVLGLPVIGLVADMDSGRSTHKNRNKGSFVAKQPRSPISKAFRSMRTSLEFFSVDQKLQTIVVTSSGPEEGKTTIASNLAVILSGSNKSVLLMDADLRRPNVHQRLNISNRAGLSDLLRGKLKLEDVLQIATEIPFLNVITSGGLPPNPSELLGSQRMEKILTDLRACFDMIVIDTPPAIVTDAQILASKTDGLIYVIRPGKTRALIAKTPLEEFNRVGVNLLGVVMNRIPHNRGYYYGGFEYYSPTIYGSEKYYMDGQSEDLFIPLQEIETDTDE
ncbi:MAG: polysaccharide biosynthesis tyrosine autokinase [Chloroflexi bacterium]|nr:polysaccharide biosynthesis tyrosine autokinase [Chloroflexota bacterium]